PLPQHRRPFLLAAVVLAQVGRLGEVDEAAAVGFDRMNPRAAVATGARRQGSRPGRAHGWVLLERGVGLRGWEGDELAVLWAHRVEAAGGTGEQVLSGDPKLVEVLLPGEVVKPLRVRRVAFRYRAINPELNRFDEPGRLDLASVVDGQQLAQQSHLRADGELG